MHWCSQNVSTKNRQTSTWLLRIWIRNIISKYFEACVLLGVCGQDLIPCQLLSLSATLLQYCVENLGRLRWFAEAFYKSSLTKGMVAVPLYGHVHDPRQTSGTWVLI